MSAPATTAATTEADAPHEAPSDLSATTHDFLKALASPTRQRIMMLFFQGAELSVGEVADRAGIGQSTASQQLTLMRRGGIVTARRDGKIVRYRGDKDGIRKALGELQAYLEDCC